MREKRAISFLRRIYWWSMQFGFDPRRVSGAISGLLPFFNDYVHFRRSYRGALNFFPSLHDRSASAGDASSEYFQQDLYVAREIFRTGPVLHVDVGSRIDGFVAHVASFREVEVIDIRPMKTAIPGVRFLQADMMSESIPQREYCDSLSCLHALEHFGLGRYGDPVNSRGHEIGLRNLSVILKRGGRLYLSVPIGSERVEFNSHRIFDPGTIVTIADRLSLALRDFLWISPGKSIRRDADLSESMRLLSVQEYALGIFIFEKT